MRSATKMDTHTSTTPMMIEPMASNTGLPVTIASATKAIASTRPTSAATSSPSTTTSSALRVLASHCRSDLLPRSFLISRRQPASEPDSSTIDAPSTISAIHGLFSGSCADSLCQPS